MNRDAVLGKMMKWQNDGDGEVSLSRAWNLPRAGSASRNRPLLPKKARFEVAARW